MPLNGRIIKGKLQIEKQIAQHQIGTLIQWVKL